MSSFVQLSNPCTSELYVKNVLSIHLPCPKGFACSSSNSSVRSRCVTPHSQHSGPGIKCEFTVSYV
ncbi:unnamed protein product [Schistosoma mattheei]|uniref:Uncharacterized protein n=1 Tax=Schistosoma mattheei TaxID=31246 RepID=A0A183Q8B7_9TREM|nr:unnamed protein product [Schistosoma mattheei]